MPFHFYFFLPDLSRQALKEKSNEPVCLQAGKMEDNTTAPHVFPGLRATLSKSDFCCVVNDLADKTC
jgi:hypothetical protein